MWLASFVGSNTVNGMNLRGRLFNGFIGEGGKAKPRNRFTP